MERNLLEVLLIVPVLFWVQPSPIELKACRWMSPEDIPGFCEERLEDKYRTREQDLSKARLFQGGQMQSGSDAQQDKSNFLFPSITHKSRLEKHLKYLRSKYDGLS